METLELKKEYQMRVDILHAIEIYKWSPNSLSKAYTETDEIVWLTIGPCIENKDMVVLKLPNNAAVMVNTELLKIAIDNCLQHKNIIKK